MSSWNKVRGAPLVIRHREHLLYFYIIINCGARSLIICFANFIDPISVGDVRHPTSGLANCILAVPTPDPWRRGVEPTAVNHKKIRPNGRMFLWWALRGSVTFRDPEKTSLKTSFQEFVSLRHADLHGSPPTQVGRGHEHLRVCQINKPSQRMDYLFGGRWGARTPDPLRVKQML